MEDCKEIIPSYGWECSISECPNNEGGVCHLEWEEDPIEKDDQEFFAE